MFDSSFLSLLWANFHFIRPWALCLLLPLALIVYIRWHRNEAAQSQQVLPEHLRKALTVGEQGWRKLLPLKLLTVLMMMGIIVSAGPTWNRYESPFNEDKAALVVLVDLSQSMLEKDVAPNRLIRAQHKILDLIELRSGGKTGLIAYAGSAHVVAPLTEDKQVFTPFVSALAPEIMPVEGKQAQEALTLVDTLLADEVGASVILFTDGMVPNAIDAYEAYFEHSAHQLLILGVGNSNREATIPLDVRSLETLASKANASLQLVTVDNQDVQWLIRKIDRHMQISTDSIMPWKDMGYYLLFPMALLLLLWFRKGWLVHWGLVLIVCGSSVVAPSPAYAATSSLPQDESASVKAQASTPDTDSDLQASESSELASQELKTDVWQNIHQAWLDFWFTPDQQGDRAFHQQEYFQAAQYYQDPLRKGIAYYYAAQYKAAQISFMQQPSHLSLFYAGSALARQREYIAARNLLRDLINEMDKSPLESEVQLRADVAHNLAAVQAIIDEINRFSESQQGTTDGLEESTELGKDEPLTSDGFEEIAPEEVLGKDTLNAREILGSEELANKWLSRVEADPKRFLQAKFYLQRQLQLQQKQDEAQ
ncbi:VWA domain-containing protein [Shewanella sp. 1_MG-2023]|uniref:VWA domain-containing protein n=1 Tax=unclassified Shewanella TaxID=196818 RepID=UPI0026E1B691|nr:MULTISPECIES: VWA domain-containing protein [unclassified Shewanella]MDO6609862.1 VWA domain-containing protein [Shewanella sp. 7_MG-2023]MDO6769996.1 VWA domain-containing protein [Shewanella sp. 2_MG-2023]MDO6793060.1 VWA domain-containing protein [Shewanella sp. 1_MG-2023]